MKIHNKEISGYVVCPKWLRLKYFEAQDYCDICKKQLTINTINVHRLIRKNSGGLYTVQPIKSRYSNVQILCNKHHKLVHSKEFN